MRVFIAEKPSLARAIAEGLGGERKGKGCIWCAGGDVVTWCYGHLLELAPPEQYNPAWKKWTVEHLPYTVDRWKLNPRDDAKEQIGVIQGLLAKASEVVNAGDPDREGQLLVDELLDHLSWKGKTSRVLLNATDPASVEKALARIEPNSKYQNLFFAAQCRQRADWLVGMNLTVAASKLLSESALISIGRVQTPTLALVVRRDLEIEKFQQKTFYSVEAEVKTGSGKSVDLVHDPEPHIFDKGTAEQLAASVRNTAQALTVKKERKRDLAPLPFILATWQQAAEKHLKIGASEALKVLQELYEAKVVSYPRSDCPYLPAEQAGDALSIARNLISHVPIVAHLLDRMEPKVRIYDSSKVTEHHGIIPTGVAPTGITGLLLEAYKLIVARFLATLLPDYEFEETKIQFMVGDAAFIAKGEKPINAYESWRVLEIKKTTLVPDVTDGERGNVAATEVKTGVTTPPKRYTEASLIADMRSVAKFVEDPKLKAKLKETSGIGTAATQASIIETLKRRGFVEIKARNIVSTEFGRAVIAALPPVLADPGVTAAWEDALTMIAEGRYPSDDFMANIARVVERRIADLKVAAKDHKIKDPRGDRGEGQKKNTTNKRTKK